MAKSSVGDARNRFTNQRCTECKTIATLGKWFRCEDENEQTISYWFAVSGCLEIMKKAQAMRVDLFDCETFRELEIVT